MNKETCNITYSGVKLGKTKTAVSLMFLEYIKNHLGKDIKVSFHDTELLDQKDARIKELEEEIKFIKEVGGLCLVVELRNARTIKKELLEKEL